VPQTSPHDQRARDAKTFSRPVEEARKLDDDRSNLSRSFDVLAPWEVFGNLVRLNPSLRESIRTMSGRAALAQH